MTGRPAGANGVAPDTGQSAAPRVALVGVAGYAKIHWEILRDLHRQGRIQLRAVVVIDPVAEAATVAELHELGIKVCASTSALFAVPRDSIDLCCIPTGIHLHAPMTLQALRHGANVLVEKPLAACLDEVARLTRTARECQRFVAVGFQDLYFPPNRWLKERLLAGDIGRLKRIRGIGLWPRALDYYARNDWAGKLRVDSAWVLDSPLNNGLAHFLNLALFWAGETAALPAPVATLAAELYRAQPIESFDTAAVRLRTRHDVEITFVVSHSSASVHEPRIELEGEAGRAVWRHNTDVTLEPKSGPVAHRDLAGYDEVRRYMYDLILRRWRDPTAFICTPEMATEHVRCIVALHRHAPIHPLPSQWLNRPEPGPGMTPQIVIDGLDDWAGQAFARGRLLSELDCPWAVPPGRGPVREEA